MALAKADITAVLLAFTGKITFLHCKLRVRVRFKVVLYRFSPLKSTLVYYVHMDIGNIVSFIIVMGCLLVAMTVHEFMHAYAGYKLGDTTARDEGRISLNPIRHMDLFTTVLLPAFTWVFLHVLILAAKPVPFNPNRVRYGDMGAALIAFAGPLSNLVLAVLTSLLMHGVDAYSFTGELLALFRQLNIALFVFNMIPIPPLDGSRVLYAFAPQPIREFMERIEPYGFFIVIALVMLGGLGGIVGNINQSLLQLMP